MVKKINSFINSFIVSSIVLALLGLCMIIFPTISLSVISYAIAVAFIMIGIYLFTLDFHSFFFVDTMTQGILMMIIGIIIMIYPDTFRIVLPIMLGIWFIMESFIKIRISLEIKSEDTPWVLTLILSIVTLICGILFIVNPINSSDIITSAFGIILVIYSISDMVDMFVFKKNIKPIVDTLKEIQHE